MAKFDEIREVVGLFRGETFMKDLYVFVNYDAIAADVDKTGAVMKESKDFYRFSVEETLKKVFKNHLDDEDLETLIEVLERSLRGRSQEMLRMIAWPLIKDLDQL